MLGNSVLVHQILMYT